MSVLDSLKRVAGNSVFLPIIFFLCWRLWAFDNWRWAKLLKRMKCHLLGIKSHFDWQIKTAWLALQGFAISGLNV